MADEFKITQTMTYENGELTDKYQPDQFKLPQATQGYYAEVFEISTGGGVTTVDFAELTTPGRLIMQSLEATTTGNSIYWGPRTSTGGTVTLGEITATDSAMLYLNSTTQLRIFSLGGSINLLIKAYEV
jgi:hypothetical protein